MSSIPTTCAPVNAKAQMQQAISSPSARWTPSSWRSCAPTSTPARGDGRPTAESVAEKLGIPVRTVREWLCDNRNATLLDEIVPLWPNIGSARQ